MTKYEMLTKAGWSRPDIEKIQENINLLRSAASSLPDVPRRQSRQLISASSAESPDFVVAIARPSANFRSVIPYILKKKVK